MKIAKVLVIVLGVALISSCNQPTKETAKETVQDHEMSEMKSGDGFTACEHASKIYWTGTKPTGAHNGIIKLKEGGKFDVVDGKLIGGEFIIDMNSIVNIDLENEEMNSKLVGHLKSADFFSVDSFPEAKFVITALDELSGNDFNTLVKGNLTIKDITNPIEFEAAVKLNEGNVSVKSAEVKLDRTLWGVNYKSKSVFKELKDKFIDDEFSITIEAYSM